jgi:hypothetical protein
MKLEDAAFWMRNWFVIQGIPHANLIFYNLPKPLGFAYRQTVALSIPMVEMNPWETFSDVGLHEIAHIFEPDDDHHGEAFWARARWLDSGHGRIYTPEFDRLWDAWESDERYQRAGKRYIHAIVAELDRRAEIWIPGHIDFTSFSNPPSIKTDYFRKEKYVHDVA